MNCHRDLLQHARYSIAFSAGSSTPCAGPAAKAGRRVGHSDMLICGGDRGDPSETVALQEQTSRSVERAEEQRAKLAVHAT